jgi:hypothetical protein
MNLKKHIDIALRAVLAVETLFLLQLPAAAAQPSDWLANAAVIAAFVPVLLVGGILLAGSGIETQATRWLRGLPRTRYIAAGCFLAATFFANVSGQIVLTDGWRGAWGGLLIAIAFASAGIQYASAKPSNGPQHDAEITPAA